MTSDVNVADVERWACALAGAALAAYGIKQLKDEHSVAGAMLAAAGGTLIYRGATGYCPVYAAAGVSTANGDTDTREELGGSGGILVEEAMTINRPAAELYNFWRALENLPMFMRHLVSVHRVDPQRSHWVAKAPAGQTVEWVAEIINEIPNELIAWRTVDGSDVVSAGSVHFERAPAGRGTKVRVRMQYDPPAGKLGSVVAWMFGDEPSQTIQEDLRRFKQMMEGGEIPTTSGQPRGRR
jgi:uncharacterized membrane protein